MRFPLERQAARDPLQECGVEAERSSKRLARDALSPPTIKDADRCCVAQCSLGTFSRCKMELVAVSLRQEPKSCKCTRGCALGCHDRKVRRQWLSQGRRRLWTTSQKGIHIHGIAELQGLRSPPCTLFLFFTFVLTLSTIAAPKSASTTVNGWRLTKQLFGFMSRCNTS